jgi:hypothetical protein
LIARATRRLRASRCWIVARTMAARPGVEVVGRPGRRPGFWIVTAHPLADYRAQFARSPEGSRRTQRHPDAGSSLDSEHDCHGVETRGAPPRAVDGVAAGDAVSRLDGHIRQAEQWDAEPTGGGPLVELPAEGHDAARVSGRRFRSVAPEGVPRCSRRGENPETLSLFFHLPLSLGHF